MTDLQLDLGVYRYEHTEPLFDGRVAIDGADVALETAPLISDIFHRMARRELDYFRVRADLLPAHVRP